MTNRDLVRVRPGYYTLGDAIIEDTYSPTGAPHTRWVTLTRNRWVLRQPGQPLRRFDRLRDARQAVAR